MNVTGRDMSARLGRNIREQLPKSSRGVPKTAQILLKNYQENGVERNLSAYQHLPIESRLKNTIKDFNASRTVM